MFPQDLLNAQTFPEFTERLSALKGKVRTVRRIEQSTGAVFAVDFSTAYADGSARSTFYFDHYGSRAVNPAFAR